MRNQTGFRFGIGKVFRVPCSERTPFTVHCSLFTLLALSLLAGTAHAQTLATGGTITRYRENTTNFIAHAFTSSDTLTVNTGTDVEYVLVAGGGGGGGGWEGAGGGAGGVLIGRANLSAAEYTITVGAG